MAYQFEKEASSTFKFTGLDAKLNITGVNSTLTADSVVSGLQGLLYIAGALDKYDVLDGVRVVNEDVTE